MLDEIQHFKHAPGCRSTQMPSKIHPQEVGIMHSKQKSGPPQLAFFIAWRDSSLALSKICTPYLVSMGGNTGGKTYLYIYIPISGAIPVQQYNARIIPINKINTPRLENLSNGTANHVRPRGGSQTQNTMNLNTDVLTHPNTEMS